jgi:hypothetical protein
MAKKYQVFISSTFTDLVEERQEVVKSVLSLGHIPSGMELFPAADIEQFKYIQRMIDDCDYYLLIIGARYGSTDAAGVSFTEKEYDYAVETNKFVLAFLHSNPSSIAAKVDIDPTLSAKLTAFCSKVSTGRLVQTWNSASDLRVKVVAALATAANDSPGVGWIRGNAAASEDVLAEIHNLRNENDKLRLDNSRLLSQLTPRVAGLAGLEEQFKVRYEYSDGGKTYSSDAQPTWAEIFTAVGPSCMRPCSSKQISFLMVKYLKENKPVHRHVLTIFDTDENTIKIHLIALGLLLSEIGQSAGGLDEFISLTEKGLQKLTEIMAVKSTTVQSGT